MFEKQEKVNIKWSSDFSYAIGLITSDGCLDNRGKAVIFTSKDLLLVEDFKTSLKVDNKIVEHNVDKRTWYTISVGDMAFCKFLNEIGLENNKSKTIEKVKIPKSYFADFLRGLFDGDGTFFSYWDKRWSNSFVFRISFASASPKFLRWLQKELTRFTGVKGFIKRGDGVLNLNYTKGDTRKLVKFMYYKNNLLLLKRKYNKIKESFRLDEKVGIRSLQKQRKPR